MKNMLFEKVPYREERTYFGTWRRYVYESGARFAEFRSNDTLFGLPLLHYTSGICPETGQRITARGIVAVGRKALGVIAIGQAAGGLLAIGQLAVGPLALGQAAFGVVAVGQLAAALYFGLGQVATGVTAIGQIALGQHVLAQFGFGEHVWDTRHADPEAVACFKELYRQVKAFFGFGA